METIDEPTPAQRFFAAVEETFGRLRGRPLLLSPRDVGLVKQWFEAGVPLRVALKGLERFFEREARRERPRSRPPTLEWCEKDVYEMWEEWKAARLGADEPRPAPDATALLVRAHLDALAPRLERAREQAEARGARAVARALQRVLRRLPELGVSGERMEDVESTLAAEEERVLRALKRDLGETRVQELHAEVGSRVETLAEGIDEKAFEVLRRKAEDRALLGELGIPRIALFSF